MNKYQFINRLKGRFILALLIITFGSGCLYAQHLFYVNYNDLSQVDANLIKTEVAKFDSSISMISMMRNRNNKDVYSFSLSSVQNTQIVIFNEETGNSVVITPVEGSPAQFELSPFFIEELRQSALGDADRYLVAETGVDFSVRNAASVPIASREVFIPRYFYGPKENVKEALPKDRQIIHIFKEKPRLIPAFPDDLENLRYVAQLEEEMNYYVYMYKLPDGTLCIYDEHFNPGTEENGISAKSTSSKKISSNLQFNLTDNLDVQQRAATLHAIDLWSAELSGAVPVDIEVLYTYIGVGGYARSFPQPHYWNPVTATWYCSSLGNQLTGYNVAPGMRDIKVEMNSFYSWNVSITSPPLYLNQVDWITIMLHEITHGLGFSAMIVGDGDYVYTLSGGGEVYTNYPGIFDRQLYQGISGSNLPDLSKGERKALLQSDNLYSGRPDSHLLAANGGNRVKMYAPTNYYFRGISVTHWDESVTSTFMLPYLNTGFRHIIIDAKEIAIMRDMGWEIPCTTIVDFTDQVVDDSTTVTNICSDINVQNVKVENGAKLTLEAAREVNIISDFEVELGSELEIK